MSEYVLAPYPDDFAPYTTPAMRASNPYVEHVMQPVRPRFNPYVIRREGRLLLAVPGTDQEPIKTFELEPVELARLVVGAHEALSAMVRQQIDGGSDGMATD